MQDLLAPGDPDVSGAALSPVERGSLSAKLTRPLMERAMLWAKTPNGGAQAAALAPAVAILAASILVAGKEPEPELAKQLKQLSLRLLKHERASSKLRQEGARTLTALAEACPGPANAREGYKEGRGSRGHQ